MPRIGDLLEYFRKYAPFSLQEEWDNVGLLVGSEEDHALKVGIALNASPFSIDMAIEDQCSLLVTHHPFFFSLKKLSGAQAVERSVIKALKNNLSVICLHTNLDRAFQGVNMALGSMLSLESLSPLVSLPHQESRLWGDGITGVLPGPVCLAHLAKHVKESWRLSSAAVYSVKRACETMLISKIAILGGSGSSYWPEALVQGADVFITGDIKYHHRIDALEQGLPLISVDHGEMEEAALFYIARNNWEKDLLPSVPPFTYISLPSWEKPAWFLE